MKSWRRLGRIHLVAYCLGTLLYAGTADAFTSDPVGVDIITKVQELFSEKPADLEGAIRLAERYEMQCDRATESSVRRWALHQMMSNSYAYFWAFTKPSILLAEKTTDLAQFDLERRDLDLAAGNGFIDRSNMVYLNDGIGNFIDGKAFDQPTGRTACACGPFAPSTVSNSTC